MPVARYSSRIADYAQYRPGYPPALLDLLRTECDLSAAGDVADVGSGTGLLSELLLDGGHRVYGVEPNADMRIVAHRRLGHHRGFVSVAASAEATTLDAASVDLVTVGRAMHWFDYDRAMAEFLRILRGKGAIAIVWLKRGVATEFAAAYEALLSGHAPRYRAKQRRQAEIEGRLLRDGFGRRSRAGRWRFDSDALRGMTLSLSVAPDRHDPAAASMLHDLDDLFRRHAEHGSVTLDYETVAYCRRVDGREQGGRAATADPA
jgi:SAM-dependent methyltransferase